MSINRTNKEIALFYFKDLSEVPSILKNESQEFTCRCGIKHKQIIRAGYGNLTTHIFAELPNWQIEVEAIEQNNSIIKYCSKKNYIYSWLY